MRSLVLIAMLLVPALIRAQGLLQPDSILIGNRPLPHVLLLGCFHFNYPGLDAHKTAKSDEVDVLSPERQKELQELLDVVMRFNPNKLAVETEGGWVMQEYRRYKTGEKPLGRNEIFQIGFRVMDRAHLDTVYTVDAGALVNDLYDGRDSLLHRPWLDSLYTGWDWGGPDRISQRYTALYAAQDQYERDNTLLNSFLSLNDDHTLDRSYGAYLHGGFELGTNQGADIHAMHWYDRNLRIFRNIQRVTASPEDRILVLFGAGHMGILKHLFDCSPAYQRVRLADLVDP